MTIGAPDVAPPHQVVEALGGDVALAEAQPADAGRQPLEPDPLRRQLEPALEQGVVGEGVADGGVGGGDVGRVAGERDPAERPLALAEQRPQVGGHEPRVGEGVGEPTGQRLAPQVVPVVEHLGTGTEEADHGLAVGRHRLPGPPHVLVRIRGAQRGRRLHVEPARHVAVERVVGRRLVGHHVDRRRPPQQLRKGVGRVGHHADRQRAPLGHRRRAPGQAVVERVRPLVEVALGQPALDPRRVDLDAQRHPAVHGHGQRLGPAHPAQAGGEHEPPGQGPAEVGVGHGGEGLERPLQDPLRADVDPRARPSSGRRRSGPWPRAARTRPRWPNRGPAASWPSAPGAPSGGCGRPRPASPTGPAASGRTPTPAARARGRGRPPSSAPPCPARRTRRARRDARPPRDRGCS